MRKIGISTDCIGKETGMAEGYRLVKEAGFDNVFFLYDGDEDRARSHIMEARIAGLEIETLHAPWDGINNIWLPGKAGDKVIDTLIKCVEFCADQGVPIAVIHLSSGVKAPCISDIGHERLDRLIGRAGELGIKLAFENQRKLANLAFVFELYRHMPHVGFCWDCGHEACFTLGRRDYMALFGEMVCCLHIHDNSGIFDEDLHMIPFDVFIDFNVVADKIRRSGYTGSIMLELKRAAYPDLNLKEFLERAANAARRLRTMVDGE